YLLQHKDNPVDWYPWGDDALERAKKEDKPIFLSIGYAACHWCHVMERESFEDPEIAAYINERFVPIKVDREERPDLDAIYMEAVQMMTGHGGWPMTVFLTPEGVPFYGGTYYPPDDRYGMPSFKKVLEAIATTWTERRSEVDLQGKQLLEHLGGAARLTPSNELLTSDPLDAALRALANAFDEEWGGFGNAPKFPQPALVDLLFRLAARGKDGALRMSNRTLDAMASGGMFDQLAGGFARYSVDRHWVVPHFEKMLYDNAQLLRTYARSWQITGSELHRTVTEMTAGWLLAEMRDAAGGFYSSLDADSEGVEGKFYVWSLDEVKRAAGADADDAIKRWGFTADGNFEGANIPVLADPGVTGPAVERARAALLAARAERVRPATDNKILSGWNALAAAALAEAGSILGRGDWIDAAVGTMEFVLDELRVDGRLMRSYGRRLDGTSAVKILGYCEDYAFTLEACLTLYESTWDERWLEHATWAADEALRLFHDDSLGGFFTTGSDATGLVIRSKDVIDDAVPAANSVLALQLQRLAAITGQERYDHAAIGALRLIAGALERSPTAFGYALGALDHYTGMPLEIVVVGDHSAAETRSLAAVATDNYLPNKVLVVADPIKTRTRLPLLEGRTDSSRPTAYVCRRGVCKLPVTEPEALASELKIA
ncbi:MAG TPA: thioredoxin domain-containing protein, partial [Actinomycetota bacterium]|nr:thioredoxin domain-containing protein [Actinomycetota bacterium]